MELIQLRYFQKVARLHSITKAAQELFISQPSLSQSLNRLENSVGCPLFIRRKGKGIELSDAGKLLLQYVDRVLQELDDGINAVRELSENAAVQVSIASSIHDLCNELLLGFLEKKPDIHISQQLIRINSLTELLLNDEIDFAISPCPLPDSRLDCRALYTEELLAIVGPGHRLYGAQEVARNELLHERFILNYSEADRNYLDMLFEDEGLDFDIVLETNEPSTIQRLVASGTGVAFVPARIMMRRFETDPGELAGILRVKDYKFEVPTCITKKRDRYLLQSAADFYNYTVDFCQKESALTARFLRQCFPSRFE